MFLLLVYCFDKQSGALYSITVLNFFDNLSNAVAIDSIVPLNWRFKFVNLSHYCYICTIGTIKL